MAFVQVLPRRLASWIAAEPDWDHVYGEQLPRVLNFFRYRLGDTADVEGLTAQHRDERDYGARLLWHRVHRRLRRADRRICRYLLDEDHRRPCESAQPGR